MDKIIYNKTNDYLYLLIYELGSGISSNVWYSIEIKNYIKTLNGNKKIFDINCKALKIFNKTHSMEYESELKINDMLNLNGTKSEYINYNEGGFIYKDYKIIVNEMMDTTLKNLCEILNYNFDNSIKEKIYFQMEESIHFMHKCNYMHNDIKLDNFLVCGLNEMQEKILSYCKNYSFKNFFKKTKQKKIKETEEKLNQLIEKIINHCDLENENYIIIGGENDDYYDDDDEENENISFHSNDTTFISLEGEFDQKHDKFHILEIDNFLEKSEDDMSSSNDNIYDENLINFYKNKLTNIKIKLNDFGLIEKPNDMRTVQLRIHRSPQNILGYACDFVDDLYALKVNKQELFDGKALIDIEEDEKFDYYDSNLLSIKKICFHNKNIFSLILNSIRRDTILASDNSFLFK